jgi:hypothetical protein
MLRTFKNYFFLLKMLKTDHESGSDSFHFWQFYILPFSVVSKFYEKQKTGQLKDSKKVGKTFTQNQVFISQNCLNPQISGNHNFMVMFDIFSCIKPDASSP